MNVTFLRDVPLISGLGFATCGHFIKGNDISSPLVTTGSLMVSEVIHVAFTFLGKMASLTHHSLPTGGETVRNCRKYFELGLGSKMFYFGKRKKISRVPFGIESDRKTVVRKDRE